MTSNYETVETGIRVRHGDRGDSFNVSVELPPRKDHNEKSYTFHVGAFRSLEKARQVKQEAEVLVNTLNGKKLTNAMQKLKDQYKQPRMCCGKKVKQAWKYCPYCGRSL